MYAGAAMAAGPEVTIGGFVDFQVGHSEQKTAYETGSFSRNTHFRDESEVHVKIEGKTDNGIGYGGVIELLGNPTSPDDSSKYSSDKVFLFVDTAWGRAEMGSVSGAEHILKVDASTFARATGGIDGDWYYYANVSPAFPNTGFIMRPDLPSQHDKGTTEDSNKISYYTPRIAGFQGGVSFTNDQGDIGTSAGFTSDSNSFQYEHVWSGGINYTNTFNDIGVAASLTGETADDENNTTERLAAWAAGVNVSYMGFTVGGSYGDWNKSNTSTGNPDFDGSYWTAGGAYAFGPAAVSVTYLDSVFLDDFAGGDNELQNLVFGADYQLAPGFVPYAEVSFFNTESRATAVDNSGSVWLIGKQGSDKSR